MQSILFHHSDHVEEDESESGEFGIGGESEELGGIREERREEVF
jgi:hypothetical protein